VEPLPPNRHGEKLDRWYGTRDRRELMHVSRNEQTHLTPSAFNSFINSACSAAQRIATKGAPCCQTTLVATLAFATQQDA
jgi:hypothetical protein